MKNWLNYLYILPLLSVSLFSCEKDEEHIVLKPGTAPALTASTATLVLDKTHAKDTVITFSATAADYGYSAGVKYTLQLDKKGNNFAAPKSVDLGSSRVFKYTVADLNATLGILKLPTGIASPIDIRIKSDISSSVAPVYSNVISITATPFADIIDYPSLYVPGGYQSWTPATAPKVSSVEDNKKYEGYVNFQEATKFKFTSNPDWDHTNYGDGGAGKLSATGGDLSADAPGYYRLKANLNDLTWSLDKTAWGIVGDATGSWDNDQDLTYDPATKVWKTSVALSVGGLKFRANHAWTINFGDVKPANGTPDYDGADIAITEAGQYDVVLNLSIPGNYSYSLTKK